VLFRSDQRNSQFTSDAADTYLATTSIGNAGSNGPFDNMQPYLVLNFCIALVGSFPSRN